MLANKEQEMSEFDKNVPWPFKGIVYSNYASNEINLWKILKKL